MHKHFLQLNDDKTEILVFESIKERLKVCEQFQIVDK